MTDMTTEDELIWQSVISDVEKLKKTKRISPSPQKKKGLKKDQSLTVPFNKNFHHTLELNTTADIDKQTFKHFKKEELGVQASLDLHGFTLSAAHEAVHNFIIFSYNQGKRAVLIITGKGLPHKEQDIYQAKGSLKQSVPEWLKSDELKNMILSFIHPSAKLGGNGALYILLRRKK